MPEIRRINKTYQLSVSLSLSLSLPSPPSSLSFSLNSSSQTLSLLLPLIPSSFSFFDIRLHSSSSVVTSQITSNPSKEPKESSQTHKRERRGTCALTARLDRFRSSQKERRESYRIARKINFAPPPSSLFFNFSLFFLFIFVSNTSCDVNVGGHSSTR